MYSAVEPKLLPNLDVLDMDGKSVVKFVQKHLSLDQVRRVTTRCSSFEAEHFPNLIAFGCYQSLKCLAEFAEEMSFFCPKIEKIAMGLLADVTHYSYVDKQKFIIAIQKLMCQSLISVKFFIDHALYAPFVSIVEHKFTFPKKKTEFTLKFRAPSGMFPAEAESGIIHVGNALQQAGITKLTLRCPMEIEEWKPNKVKEVNGGFDYVFSQS